MKRTHVLRRPMAVEDIDMYEMADENQPSGHSRAEKARLRRWRRVKHQVV